MGLFDFLAPKWKSRNPETRLAAVKGMGNADVSRLKELVAGDSDVRVRLAALERIEDGRVLEELFGRGLSSEVQQAARAKLERLLCAEVIAGSNPAGAETSIARIQDPALIERLSVEAPSPALRVKAVQRIDDEEALCRIVETSCGKEAARAAVSRVTDEALLARIARSGSSKIARRLAAEKLEALAPERTPPSPTAPEATPPPEPQETDSAPQAARAAEPTEADRAALEALKAVEGLVGGLDEDVEQRFREAEARWAASASAGGGTPLAGQFVQACQRYRAAAETIGAERSRLGALSSKLEGIESRTGGADLEARQAALAELDRTARETSFRYVSAGDFFSRLEREREECGRRIAADAEDRARAKREASERRKALCEELEALAAAEDFAARVRRAKELRDEWKALPASKDSEAKALGLRFREAVARIDARRAALAQEQEWLHWNNRKLKEELCEAVESFDAAEDLEAVAEGVREAQRRWKEIGPVPRAESEALWQRFRAACDRSFERCKPYFDEVELQRSAVVERLEALCAAAEAHVESTDWKTSADALKALQAEWRAAGSAPRKQQEELYARFRQACNRFFARRQAHLAEVEEDRKGNQAAKERLCERAEALAAETDRRHAKAFRELQAEWKQVGPAPREVEQALWERFRGACDRYFAWLDSGRLENLRLKEALCEEAEALAAEAAAGTVPPDLEARLEDIQKRWMKIGAAPKAQNDAVWERFHKPLRELVELRAEPPGGGAG